MVSESPAFITKVLLPRRSADILPRPRLLNFLHQHIDRRLILISAAAGYGKTTLLIDFCHDTSLPVCWYTLDEADRDPRNFLDYLLAAIRQRFPDFGRRTGNMLSSATDVGRELTSIIGTLVNEIHDIAEYFMLVLDDYHWVDDSPVVNEMLDLLLYYLPDNCHIILSSRTIPKLTFSRLAARQQVVGLGTADLRFNGIEVRDLLSLKLNRPVSDQEAEELARESEGWIAGIYLTTYTFTLWHGLTEAMTQVKGRGGQLFDFLASEVYDRQSPAVQEFLLASAVLPQINPQQCDDLTGRTDSQAMLDRLEDLNLFITRLEGKERWYRYHNLFRDFLETKLHTERPSHYLALHQRAGALAQARREWNEAIGHYIKAGDYEQAAEMVEGVADDLFRTGRWHTLQQWIDGLPQEMLRSRPRLATNRAKVCLQVGELERAHQLLTEALLLWQEKEDVAGAATALTWRSIVARFGGRGQAAVEDGQRALQLVSTKRLPAIAAEAYKQVGICYGAQGDFRRAIAALEEALALLQEDGDLYSTASVNNSLGIAYAKLGDLPKAAAYYQQAIHNWEAIGNAGHLAETLTSMGVLHYYRGEYNQALETFAEALARAKEGGYLRIEAYALASIGDTYYDLEKYEAALEAYDQALDIGRRVEEQFLMAYCLDAMGKVYRCQGNRLQAKKLVELALHHAEERSASYEIGLYKTSLGILLGESGELGAARQCLSEAAELLAQRGAKRELATAQFHLAYVLFLEGEEDEAMGHLATALRLATELGYDQFLVVEGRRAMPLLESALARKAGGDQLAAIYQRAVAGAPVAAKELEVLPEEKPIPSGPRRVEIYALGEAKVMVDGQMVPRSVWATEKALELFFLLLAHPLGLRREQIIEMLWPDLPLEKSGGTFHSTVHRLRRALDQKWLSYEDNKYSLRIVGQVWTDVDQIEALMGRAEKMAPGSDEAAACYQEAIELYCGDYLEGVYSDWCGPRRARLMERYLQALERLAEFHARRKEYQRSIALYQQALARDNFQHEAHYQLLCCYMAAGDHLSAIKHYRHYARLQKELGLRPAPKVVALYDKVLRGQPIVEVPE